MMLPTTYGAERSSSRIGLSVEFPEVVSRTVVLVIFYKGCLISRFK
jgi:hypothetical protein